MGGMKAIEAKEAGMSDELWQATAESSTQNRCELRDQ
jgi:hypothetical protein